MLALLRAVEGVEVECLELPLPWAALPRSMRQLRALVRSQFSGLPAKANYAFGSDAGKMLTDRLAGGAVDCVIFNGADLLPLRHYVPPGVKTILVSHNVESDLIRDQVKNVRLPGFMKTPLITDAARTQTMEIEGARAVNLVVAISEGDADWYRHNAGQDKVIVIPAAFTQPPYCGKRPDLELPLKLAFLAKMSWWPNRQGGQWLVEKVLPQLPSGRVEAHFYGPGTEGFDGYAHGISGHGFVESLGTIWGGAHFTLCPILGGSGVNIKLLESLYNGVPVLTTPRGCRGLPPIDDPALAVVEPEDWASFLASDDAVQLAKTKVRAETSAMFSGEQNVGMLKAALQSL